MGKVYALLIGIDDYPPGTSSLEGCVADIDDVAQYLGEHFSDAAVLKLTNADATYANVIAQIRRHLGRAGKDDVAYLHYSGHGGRSKPAPEFLKFDRDDHDEGLVCHDSRVGDNFDLADKELAWLIADLAKNEPHIAWVLDCCHSGSGTRGIKRTPRTGVRGAGEGNFPRPLESYLEGQYATLLKQTGALRIPQARHMLMAGCDRTELAKEDLDNRCGIFSRSLYDVLRETGGDLSYAELFGRARVRVSEYIRSVHEEPQRPQFEAVAGFDGWQGFLGRARRIGRRSFIVSKVPEGWSAQCGALGGLSLNPDKPVVLALAAETAPDVVLGSARVTRVGGTSSDVVPDFAADPAVHYLATVTSLPDPPLRLKFSGDTEARAAVAKMLADDAGLIAELADEGSADDGFELRAETEQFTLLRRDNGVTAATVRRDDPVHWGKALLAALAHVAQWRHLLDLRNPSPQLDPALVDLSFVTRLRDGTEQVNAAPAITLAVPRTGGATPGGIGGEFRLRNRTGQPLNFALLHFTDDYGIELMAQGQAAPSDLPMTLSMTRPDGTCEPEAGFWLNNGEEAVEQLKLVLATEPIESFLLAMEPLKAVRGGGSMAAMKAATRAIDDDWFTLDLRIRVTPLLAEVGAAPVSLAAGQVSVARHDGVTAQLALVETLGASRGVGAEDSFAAALASAGIHAAQLGGARGEAAAALDITDISDPAVLADNPLKVRLALPLGADEILIPMVRDGAYLLPAGDFWKDADGATQVELRHVPAPLVDHRSLSGALRMYFFKAVLGLDHVNRLRLVSFGADGTASYTIDGRISSIKAASRVLVVIHGIIGDTRGLLEGMHAAGLTAGFDCVLAYDYENLTTAIEQTARTLKQDLADVGLAGDDGKHLTVLAHSMGGLVARWLIEKEGGAATVDHLVMCGTPNAGSPFGEVGKARKVLLALMSLGAYAAPAVCGSIAGVLSASARLTPTLEQMAPGSEFITALNGAGAGATRYTILAGDIDAYQADDQAMFDGLMAKITRSAPLDLLFDKAANDIAVKTHSILLNDVLGDHPAARVNVACHHLNYFSCPAGQAALRAVEWQ